MKIKVQSQMDRDNLIIALANNGYKVYIETEKDVTGNTVYYVVFEENPRKEG